MQTVMIKHNSSVQPFAERFGNVDSTVDNSTLKQQQKYDILQQAKVKTQDRITVKTVKSN